MNRRLGLLALTLCLASCGGDSTAPPDPTPEAPPVVPHTPTPRPETLFVAMAMLDGDHQTGTVGLPLAAPLRVKVLVNGAPRAGFTVYWETLTGSLPFATTTNQAGIASAEWTLGTTVGARNAKAYMGASIYASEILFTATAKAGPAATVVPFGADSIDLPTNHVFRAAFLSAAARDQYGNPAAQPITWTIESGPLMFYGNGPQAPQSREGPSVGVMTDGYTLGVGRVRASIPSGAAISYAVNVVPPRYEILIFDIYGDDPCFISQQNASGANGVAAVDTVPVGATVRWINGTTYGTPTVESVPEPGFPASGPIAPGGSYSVTFNVPGTYRYVEASDHSMFGMVIVR